MRKYALSLEMIVKLAKGLTDDGFTKDKYGSVTRKFLSKNSANKLRMYITPSVYQEVLLQENNERMLEFINNACKIVKFDAYKNMLAYENEKKLLNGNFFKMFNDEETINDLLALREALVCNLTFVSKNENILRIKDELNSYCIQNGLTQKPASILSIREAINEMEEYTIFKK